MDYWIQYNVLYIIGVTNRWALIGRLPVPGYGTSHVASAEHASILLSICTDCSRLTKSKRALQNTAGLPVVYQSRSGSLLAFGCLACCAWQPWPLALDRSREVAWAYRSRPTTTDALPAALLHEKHWVDWKRQKKTTLKVKTRTSCVPAAVAKARNQCTWHAACGM